MHIDENNKLILSNELETSIETDYEQLAKIYFWRNKYSTDLLTKYLDLAAVSNRLASAKKSKLKEILINPYLKYSLEEYKNKGLLDPSRIEAIELINNFTPGDIDNADQL